jgi:hypothetical protein
MKSKYPHLHAYMTKFERETLDGGDWDESKVERAENGQFGSGGGGGGSKKESLKVGATISKGGKPYGKISSISGGVATIEKISKTTVSTNKVQQTRSGSHIVTLKELEDDKKWGVEGAKAPSSDKHSIEKLAARTGSRSGPLASAHNAMDRAEAAIEKGDFKKAEKELSSAAKMHETDAEDAQDFVVKDSLARQAKIREAIAAKKDQKPGSTMAKKSAERAVKAADAAKSAADRVLTAKTDKEAIDAIKDAEKAVNEAQKHEEAAADDPSRALNTHTAASSKATKALDEAMKHLEQANKNFEARGRG